MCDTLGFIRNGHAVFAKNSDRSPNEPQILEYYPAGHPSAQTGTVNNPCMHFGALLGKRLPAAYFEERDELENQWMQAVEALCDADAKDDAFRSLTERCYEEEKAFCEKWSAQPLESVRTSKGFTSRWAKKNTVLEKEATAAVHKS